MEPNITESYRVFLATKTAFPTDQESTDAIKQEIKRWCKDMDVGFKSAMVDNYLARVKVSGTVECLSQCGILTSL